MNSLGHARLLVRWPVWAEVCRNRVAAMFPLGHCHVVAMFPSGTAMSLPCCHCVVAMSVHCGDRPHHPPRVRPFDLSRSFRVKPRPGVYTIAAPLMSSEPTTQGGMRRDEEVDEEVDEEETSDFAVSFP